MKTRLVESRFLAVLAVVWFLMEWFLALPALWHDGFGPWHQAAFMRLRHDTAFQLIVLDYTLAYALALGLSIQEARRTAPRLWPVWTLTFVLATAPAMLLFWALRRPDGR